MQNRNKIVGLIILLVVIAVGAYALFGTRKSHNSDKSSEASQQSKLGEKKEAPAGELATGFPSDLVLDSNAKVNNSYSVQYDSNTKQYTAKYELNKPVAQVYNDYLDYMTKNKYKIVNKVVGDKVSSIYATNDLSDVNIVLSKDLASGKDVAVITYLQKK